MHTKEKAGTVATVTSLENHSINAGGENQSNFVFDFATKTVGKQECEKCHPHLAAKAKRGARIKLCPDCIAGIETTAEVIHHNLQQHKTARVLDSWCQCCEKPKAATIVFKKLGVCRQCVEKLRASTASARNRIFASVANNTLKNLRRAIV